MHIRRIALALIGLGFVLAMAPSTSASLTVDGHYQGFGDSAGFLNILPPGQDGVLNGPEALQAQAGQYPPTSRTSCQCTATWFTTHPA